MKLHDYPTRFLIAAVLASLLLFGLCGTVAVYLNEEQGRTADALTEDIGSRREAANIEEALSNLAALYEGGVKKVEPLHGRIEEHLTAITRFANKRPEQEHAKTIADSYQTYLRMWPGSRNLPSSQQALLARHLRSETIPACRQLRIYNSTQIDESEQAHRRALQRMSWGLAIVGGLGSVAGLVLGYGLARKLRHTIHQFLVRVQGAADRLGQELPAIEWEPDALPRDGADDLISRVEQAVGKLQQQEREVRRAERLAALGQLAAGIAHEIRNPLTAAILLIQTGRRDPGAGGLTDEDLDLVEGELERIEVTLQAFLDYARPPKLERQPCDLAAVINDALALIRGRASQQRVSVQFDGPSECLLAGDREQLRQVVLNLVLNALDVMPHGGTVTVRLSRLAETQTVQLTVSDTGPGISPAVLPRLFQPFTTGKETGLGLGLVVSHRIVEDHGGNLRGFNLPEGGACFVVGLPMQRAEPASVPAPGQRREHAQAAAD